MTYRTRDRRIYRRNDFPATSPNRRTRTSAPPIARNRAAQTEAAPVAEPQPIEASQSTRLGELQTQVQARKTDAQQKQTAAKNAYQQYVSFLDQPSSGNFLEQDMTPATEKTAQQESLLQASVDARNRLYEAQETYVKLQDIYRHQCDMQTISNMTDIEKIALELSANDIHLLDNLNLIASLTPEQRTRMRSTGNYYKILTKPKQYLKESGYTDEEISQLSETYRRDLNEDKMEQMQRGSQIFAEEHPIISSIFAAPADLVGKATSGLSSIGSAFWHDMDLSNYNSLDVNSRGYMPMVFADTVKETVSNNLPGEFGVLYDQAMNITDSKLLTKITDDNYSDAINILGTIGSGARNTVLNGGNSDEALLIGIVDAGVEWAGDQLLSTALSAFDMPENLAEAIPALAFAISYNTADTRIYQTIMDETDYVQRQVANLMQLGLSEKEAKEIVYKNTFLN